MNIRNIFGIMILIVFILSNLSADENLIYIDPSISNWDDQVVDRVYYDTANPANKNTLHGWAEAMYNRTRIDSIFPSEKRVKNDPTYRWGLGSYGHGYYTKTVTLDDDWNKWINDNGGSKYQGTHPLIRDTARRILGYMHKYRSGDPNVVYRDRVRKGLKYLVDQQKNDGTENRKWGYIWWHGRDDLLSPTLDDYDFNDHTYVVTYSQSLAIKALSEGYWFLKENDPSQTYVSLESIRTAITTASYWLIKTSKKYNTYRNQDEGWKTVINLRAFLIEGLVEAYYITNDISLINRAVDFYENSIKGFQNDDGTWENPDSDLFGTSDYYHDSHPYYAGIIIRGLAKLYNSLPENYSNTVKQNLQKTIVDNINHFLDIGENGDCVRRMIDATGQFYPYYLHGDGHLAKGHQLSQALLEVLRCDFITENEDIISLNNIINGIVYADVFALNTEPISSSNEIQMNSLGLYSDRNNSPYNIQESFEDIVFYSINDEKIDIYKKTSSINSGTLNAYPYDLLSSGDYNNDGVKEIALYRRFFGRYKDGEITLFKPTEYNNPGSNTWDIQTKWFGFDFMETINYRGQDEIVLYDKDIQNLKIYSDSDVTMFNVGDLSADLMATGDFNRDGEDDIVFYNRSTNEIIIYDISDIEHPKASTIYTWDEDARFDLMETIDYNNDGYDDLALYSKLGRCEPRGLPPNYVDNNLIIIIEMIIDEDGKINKIDIVTEGCSTTGGYFDLMTTGDFDQDGKDEFAFYRGSVDRVTFYRPYFFGGGWPTTTLNVENDYDFITTLIWDRSQPLSKQAVVNNDSKLPTEFSLSQNYPNPFNPITTIQYDLPEASNVQIAIFDLLGRQVTTIINRFEEPGYKQVIWNATNSHGQPVGAGVYFYQIRAEEFVQTRKMVLLK